MLGRMRLLKMAYWVVVFTFVLSLHPVMAEARGRALNAEATRVAAKIAAGRKTWRGLYQSLTQKQQGKLDWELSGLVKFPDQINVGSFLAERFAVYLRGEDTVFHITVVTDGRIEGIEQFGLELFRPVPSFSKRRFAARATFPQILALTKLRNVVRVELCEKAELHLDESVPHTDADLAQGIQFSTGHPNSGEGVIVGIVDTGIDWRHEDLIDDMEKSRILYLWDQKYDERPYPEGFPYGREYDQSEIDDAIYYSYDLAADYCFGKAEECTRYLLRQVQLFLPVLIDK